VLIGFPPSPDAGSPGPAASGELEAIGDAFSLLFGWIALREIFMIHLIGLFIMAVALNVAANIVVNYIYKDK